ncbi:hypothetical protein NL676_015710 [Syzygium grande]|nr:hypothetical protein NL676_015710 [Syzygium grande]
MIILKNFELCLYKPPTHKQLEPYYILSLHQWRYGDGHDGRVPDSCRHPDSCRKRWENHLNPTIKKGELSPNEKETIKDLHKKEGNKWSSIAKQLPGCTADQIKVYCNSSSRHRDAHPPIPDRDAHPPVPGTAHPPVPNRDAHPPVPGTSSAGIIPQALIQGTDPPRLEEGHITSHQLIHPQGQSLSALPSNQQTGESVLLLELPLPPTLKKRSLPSGRAAVSQVGSSFITNSIRRVHLRGCFLQTSNWRKHPLHHPVDGGAARAPQAGSPPPPRRIRSPLLGGGGVPPAAAGVGDPAAAIEGSSFWCDAASPAKRCGDSARNSPTTPLSWSAGTASSSGTADGLDDSSLLHLHI